MITEFTEFDGGKVLDNVYILMNAIKLKNPLLVFKLGGEGIITYTDDNTRVEIKTSLKVFYSDMPEREVGEIGFNRSDKYWVNSRLIQNGKFSHWSGKAHTTKESKHIKNTVKDALKYLEPISFIEVARETSTFVIKAVNNKKQEVRAQANNKLDIDKEELFEELLHLSSIGYQSPSPKFQGAISFAVQQKEEFKKYFNYEPKFTAVWVKPNSIEYLEGIKANNPEPEVDSKVVDSKEKLPEHVRDKMFVLDVTDKNTFVEDIGVKQYGGVYWVIQ